MKQDVADIDAWAEWRNGNRRRKKSAKLDPDSCRLRARSLHLPEGPDWSMKEHE